jgi:kumamolisin
MVTNSKPLSGSEVPALPASEYVGPAPADDRLVVSVYLKIPEQAAAEFSRGSAVPAVVTGRINAVVDWARDVGLEVVDTDPMAGRVRLAGSIADLQRAFGVELRHYRKNGHDYLSYEGSLYLPDHLHPVVQAVLGLDTRPIARHSLPRPCDPERRISPARSSSPCDPL